MTLSPLLLGVGLLLATLFGAVGSQWVGRRNKSRSAKKFKRVASSELSRRDDGNQPVRVTLTPRSVLGTVDLAVLQRQKKRQVPKVEHDGTWHTLH